MAHCEKTISILIAGLFAGAVHSQEGPFVANLTGAQEVPPVESTALGVGLFQLNQDSTQLTYRLGLQQSATQPAPGDAPRFVMAHLHCAPQGQAGPVIADLLGPIRGGVIGPVEISATLSDANIVPESEQSTNEGTTCSATTGAPITTLAELIQAITAGNIYVNAHSDRNPAGEIRGQLISITAGGQPPGEQPPGEQPPGEQPPGEQPAQ